MIACDNEHNELENSHDPILILDYGMKILHIFILKNNGGKKDGVTVLSS